MKRELAHVSTRLWLVSLAVFVAFSIWLWLWHFPDDHSAQYHLLGALAEAMAAVLGLVFTISLVVAEMTASYSHRLLPRVLTPVTIGYIVLFIIATMVPLVLMAQASAEAVKASLMLGGLALVLLIPYFRYFIYRIGPTALLNDLAKSAADNLRAGREAAEVETIDNVGMSALGFKDYDIFRLALEKLGELALVGKSETDTRVQPGSIWGSLRDISLMAVSDPRALRLSVSAVQKAGLAAVGKEHKQAAGQASDVLEKTGMAVAEKGIEEGTREVVFALGGLGRAATEGKLQGPARNVVYGLGQMVRAVKYGNMAVLTFVVDSLEEIGVAALDNDLKDIAQQVANMLGEVGVQAAGLSHEEVASQAAFALLQLRSRKGGVGVVGGVLNSLRSDSDNPGALEQFLRDYGTQLQ